MGTIPTCCISRFERSIQTTLEKELAMSALIAPLFNDLAKLPQRQTEDHVRTLVFEHGQIQFQGKRVNGKAEIAIDLWRSRDLLPSVSAKLQTAHQAYLVHYPEVCRKGADSKFGPTVIHFHVRIEDADEWLSQIFDIVSNSENLLPAQTAEQAIQEVLGQICSGVA